MSMKLENVEIVKLLPPWMRQDEANAQQIRELSFSGTSQEDQTTPDLGQN